MKYCPDCGKSEQETMFYPKSTCCKACNQEAYGNYSLGDLLKKFYQPEYPPHIQAYLDKRKERLSMS